MDFSGIYCILKDSDFQYKEYTSVERHIKYVEGQLQKSEFLRNKRGLIEKE